MKLFWEDVKLLGQDKSINLHKCVSVRVDWGWEGIGMMGERGWKIGMEAKLLVYGIKLSRESTVQR